ncbi:MAG: integrase arm-type DNA-binding domain-containing protein [Pseudomonadales bacterium]|nr:integrase arm-type DNA-binding domain-containing protein [Pseudomonadales bacterium]
MPSVRLTKKIVDAITLPTDPKKPCFYRDEILKGFGLKVTSQGRKTFIVEKRIDNKVRRLTLGTYGELTVEQARKSAQQMLGEIAQGKNPIAERQSKRLKGKTLEEAFEDYLSTRKELKQSTHKDYNKALNTYLSDWRNKPITDITKDMVELRHSKIGKSSPSRANGTMRVLRAVFNHAINKYEDSNGKPLLHINPVQRLSQNRAWFPDKRKQTLIKAHELKPWYEATMQLNREVTRDYLHFLLFTGLRRSEATHLTWDQVDFKDRTFTISETKNNDVHTLPMSNFVEALLLQRFSSSDSPYIFPSPMNNGPLTEPRTAITRVTDLSGVIFTCHDLRRTFITIAESLDIPAYALKRLLNHRDQNDVTAGYIVKNVERLRRPMQQITDFILEAIESKPANL